MRFAGRLLVGGEEVRILSDRWYLERNAPGRAVLEVEAAAPLAGLVTYAIGWGGQVEPWFTGYVVASIAIDAKRQRLRIAEVDRVLGLPVPMALRNVPAQAMLAAVSEATGVTWRIGPGVDLATRCAHLVNLGTARAALQRLGALLGVAEWTIQATPTGEVYLGPAAGLHPRDVQLPAATLSEVTTEGASIGALPRLRPGSTVRPGNGDAMAIGAVELSADTYRLHWERARP